MDQKIYWCLAHDRVEFDDDRCRTVDLLGPYPDIAAAEQALETVRRRNEIADAEDRRWE